MSKRVQTRDINNYSFMYICIFYIFYYTLYLYINKFYFYTHTHARACARAKLRIMYIRNDAFIPIYTISPLYHSRTQLCKKNTVKKSWYSFESDYHHKNLYIFNTTERVVKQSPENRVDSGFSFHIM